MQDNIDVIDTQYRGILYVDWTEAGVFANNIIPTDAVSFWSRVLEYKDPKGNSVFDDLANYALSCLTTRC
jgi:hypothetical protein